MSGLWSPLADACQDFADAYWSGADNATLADYLSAMEKAVGRTRLTYAALLAGPLPDLRSYCAHCGQEFRPRPAQHADLISRYCRTACRNAARRWRRDEAARRAREGEEPCPTPPKVAYPTWAAADAAVARTPDTSVGLRSYECCCGSFHIGHSNRWAIPIEESHEQHA